MVYSRFNVVLMKLLYIRYDKKTFVFPKIIIFKYSNKSNKYCTQCLSQDLETGCQKLAVVKFLGVQIFKGDHNILIFQP